MNATAKQETLDEKAMHDAEAMEIVKLRRERRSLLSDMVTIENLLADGGSRNSEEALDVARKALARA